jgi:hypothetical protein
MQNRGMIFPFLEKISVHAPRNQAQYSQKFSKKTLPKVSKNIPQKIEHIPKRET